MKPCIIGAAQSAAQAFFDCWNISKECLVKSYCKNKSCIEISHLYISKVKLENLENYLHIASDQCKIWLGKVKNERPFYSNVDLRNYVYGSVLKGHSVSIECKNSRCLNLDHMYLVSKISNIRENKIKLTLSKAKEIRSLWAEGQTPEELSETYKITKQAVSLILNNKSWFDSEYTPKSRQYRWKEI